MRRYVQPGAARSHCVSISRSSGLLSLSRVMATLASRTSGACRLSACAQRAMVRLASCRRDHAIGGEPFNQRAAGRGGPSWRAARAGAAGGALSRQLE